MRVRSETKSEVSEYQTWLDSSIQHTLTEAKDESKSQIRGGQFIESEEKERSNLSSDTCQIRNYIK